ncbi:MAG TPA: ATP-binding protein [Candidatus Hydrogenedens sp.]|nr:ATP-binding protein [Candidatus Hydrogenedens sp.]HOL19177.1 ATP-binding protein [Candidatus Hydrogenedens sp.]HPP58393.1 ATP-binding protein [Candidatus Hydrogenedens sp.]
MRDDLKITFRSHPKLLKPIRALIKNYLDVVGFSKDRIDDIVLGLDEACTNCIRHAYHNSRSGIIQLTARLGTVWLEFEIQDCGACPPKNFLDRKEVAPLQPTTIKPHGLGLIILKRAFEEIQFNVDNDGRNCLILRTRRKGFKKG